MHQVSRDVTWHHHGQHAEKNDKRQYINDLYTKNVSKIEKRIEDNFNTNDVKCEKVYNLNKNEEIQTETNENLQEEAIHLLGNTLAKNTNKVVKKIGDNFSTNDDKCKYFPNKLNVGHEKIRTDKKYNVTSQKHDIKQIINSINNYKIIYERFAKKQWRKQNIGQNNTCSFVKRNDARASKWNFHLMLILLLVFNAAAVTSAEDASSGFSSSLTSRMIASFLGYPHSCTLGGQSRPCTLTLSCWLRGGTRLRGCGGWLFSCCAGPREVDNSVPSTEWKYKVSPPKLRQVPQRSVMPNNVFRRRVDDDTSQMDCGLPSSRILQKRIIGGREAKFAEFPWQAHVRISEFQCGGVLVSRWYVATAAHCVSRALTRDIVVWLGAIDTSATHHPARKLGIVQKILHPLFQFRMTQPDRYDIALLKFSRPITYTNHILPICLPDYDLELRGRSGVIAGWGKTDASSGHTGTNLLRSANVPILSKEQCINWHQSKQILVEIHSEMICAGHPDGHQDACLGDSGGPLIVLDNGRYYLVGITSAGFGCGVDHQPGIYHNVKMTANWIRGVISPALNYVDV